MRVAATPKTPPSAPQAVSSVFQTSPSCPPSSAWTTSIAAEYDPTSSAARPYARALGPSALSALNPTSAKAAMLYALRSSTCHESDAGDVMSYTALLVAAQNRTAAMSSATALQNQLDPVQDVS